MNRMNKGSDGCMKMVFYKEELIFGFPADYRASAYGINARNRPYSVARKMSVIRNVAEKMILDEVG